MNHVDSPSLNFISFCSGAGALDIGVAAALAAHGIGARHVAFCEREAAPCATLRARMEDKALECAPIWGGNLEEFPGASFHGVVDGITAGFPCQPHSVAGGRKGRDDERNLLPEILKQADASGTWILFLENVSGLKKEFDYIAALLLQRGWDPEWGTLYASAVGANHRRDRWFCVAIHQRAPRSAKQWLESRRRAYQPAPNQPMPGPAGGNVLACGDDAHRGQHVPQRGAEGGIVTGGGGGDVLANGAGGRQRKRRKPSGPGRQPDGHQPELGDAHNTGLQGRHNDSGQHPGECLAGSAGPGVVGHTAGDEQRRDSDTAHGPGEPTGRPGGPLADTDRGGCGKPDSATPALRESDAGPLRGSEGMEHPGCAGSRGSEDAQDPDGIEAPADLGRTDDNLANGPGGIGERGGHDGEGGSAHASDGGHSMAGILGIGIPIFAPGPNDPQWLAILAACPFLAPALPVSEMVVRETWCPLFGGTEVETEPGLCGMAYGLESAMGRALCFESSRADMLRITGNGVVWQQAAWAFYQLLHRVFAGPPAHD